MAIMKCEGNPSTCASGSRYRQENEESSDKDFY